MVIFFAEEVQRRDEPHPQKKRVARLGDISSVFEIVVTVPIVVGRSQGNEQRVQAVWASGLWLARGLEQHLAQEAVE